MPGNRSLDEFAGEEPDDAPSSDRADAAGNDPPDTADEGVDQAADDAPSRDDQPTIEPMAETYTWSASGGPCRRCGATAESRWREDGDLVCEDCKVW